MLKGEKEFPQYYAVKHKKLSERLKSRSGGFFVVLSDYIFEQKGVVYGCLMDDSFIAIHAKATNREECQSFHGSKYVQSDLKDVFSSVKMDLRNGLYVIFSGTSCQVDGLKHYLTGIDTSKLLLIDIICQGVPSPLMWEEYIRQLKKRYSDNLTFVDFRDKRKYGWGAHVLTFAFDKKIVHSDKFAYLFYSHICIRPTCYCCPFKGEHRPSDISLADFWGIDKAVPGFNDDNGVSLVLINSKKGQSYFNAVEDQIQCVRARLSDCLQPPLVGNFDIPKQRESFWKEYRTKGFNYVLKHYVKFDWKQRVRWEIKSILRKKK